MAKTGPRIMVSLDLSHKHGGNKHKQQTMSMQTHKMSLIRINMGITFEHKDDKKNQLTSPPLTRSPPQVKFQN
jgi:hypothetical protein